MSPLMGLARPDEPLVAPVVGEALAIVGSVVDANEITEGSDSDSDIPMTVSCRNQYLFYVGFTCVLKLAKVDRKLTVCELDCSTTMKLLVLAWRS
jgi:hypothetical protein